MPLADRALVVGISRYPGITDLTGPEYDATDFYAWVTDPAGGGVQPAHAKLIRSSDFPAVIDAKDAHPAQEQIHDFFTDIDIAAAANNDAGEDLGLRAGRRLWLFFSGHGFAPSLEMSGVLMANATSKRIHNVGVARWADRFYEGGWFDEVLLFQDACRSRIASADLDGVFLLPRSASLSQQRRRFYAFSAKDRKLSKEITCSDKIVRGVFTATLLDGLRGAARDPVSGAITARTLKTYLQDNMKSLLSPQDQADPEIANEPDVRDYDAFDIVPAVAPAAVAVATYPVEVTLPTAGLQLTLEDGNFTPIQTVSPPGQTWSTTLPRGLYRLVVAGRVDTIFQVTGPGSGAGGIINVSA